MVTENIKRTIKRNISWLRAQIKFCQAQTRQISHLVHQPWIINYYILQLKIWPAYLAQLYKTTWIRYREIKACTAIHFYNCHPWTIWKSCFLLSLDKLWLHFRTFQFIIVHIGKKSLRVSYFFFFFTWTFFVKLRSWWRARIQNKIRRSRSWLFLWKQQHQSILLVRCSSCVIGSTVVFCFFVVVFSQVRFLCNFSSAYVKMIRLSTTTESAPC